MATTPHDQTITAATATAATAAAGGKKLAFKPSVRMKRVSFYIPEQLYDDIQAFAQERGDSVAGVLRWSLGVGKVIWDEIKSGDNTICSATDSDDVRRRQLIFSRY